MNKRTFLYAIIPLLIIGCKSSPKPPELPENLIVVDEREPNVQIATSNEQGAIFFGERMNSKYKNFDNNKFRFHKVSSNLEMSFENIDKSEGNFILKVSNKDEIIAIGKESIRYSNFEECKEAYEHDKEDIFNVLKDSSLIKQDKNSTIMSYKGVKYSIEDNVCRMSEVINPDYVSTNSNSRKYKKESEFLREYSYSFSVITLNNYQ